MGSPSAGRSIAFATYGSAPDTTPDDRLAVGPISERCGARVEAVPWDAPAVDWSRFSTVLIRSTWDYHRRVDEFFTWTERVEAAGATLWNPGPVVRWNADKGYLRDLEDAGVAVVPTEWIPRGAAPDLERVLRRRGWERAVVKPSVSATAFRTWLTPGPVGAGENGTSREPACATWAATDAALEDILECGDAMVQPFLRGVRAEGEWSFVFFAAEGDELLFSHAVLKRPAPGDFRVQSEFGGKCVSVVPPRHLLDQAERAAAAVTSAASGPLLYARLDGVVSQGIHAPAGTFLLMEAELVEPVLFLSHADRAPVRFAEALRWRLAAAGPARP